MTLTQQILDLRWQLAILNLRAAQTVKAAELLRERLATATAEQDEIDGWLPEDFGGWVERKER
jgi:hypothetical protein